MAAVGETASRAKRAVELNGDDGAGQHAYASLLGFRSFGLGHLMKSLHRGFAFGVLEHLSRSSGIHIDELTATIGIPSRTLARRKSDGRFSMEESDRILRLARLIAKTLVLFEADAAAASKWMRSPQRALGSETPLSLAATELGQREVEALIDRLEQGVFT